MQQTVDIALNKWGMDNIYNSKLLDDNVSVCLMHNLASYEF